jgi:KDO2-lipid IV(A) lauroyltransferase
MICEIAQAPRKIHDTNWRRHIRVVGKRELVQHLLDVRALVLVSGHFGNFEMASFTLGLLGVPTFAVARPLDNPYLQRWLLQFREASGQYFLPKQGSSPLIEKALSSGAALALLADQHAGSKGIWVEFFGRPASCHKALALFTLVHQAPLLVGYAKRLRRPLDFEMSVVGVADPAQPDERTASAKALTVWYSQMLERVIRSAPDQYWWLHRRWREPPEHVRRKAEKRAA